MYYLTPAEAQHDHERDVWLNEPTDHCPYDRTRLTMFDGFDVESETDDVREAKWVYCELCGWTYEF